MCSVQFVCIKLNKSYRRIAFLCVPLQKYPYQNAACWPPLPYDFDVQAKQKIIYTQKN
jgi:hypothetical protein